MELSAVDSDNFTLDSFIEFLYGGLEGFVYLAASDPSVGIDPVTKQRDWKQEFFKYPAEVNKLKSTIRGASASHDVYLAPAIYSSRSAQRSAVLGTNVVWTEFDGNTPTFDSSTGGTPSLLIRSSGSNNHHVYWRLDEPVIGADAIEEITRRITYNMQADESAWDATQVLRPPETFNYKYGDPIKVEVESYSGFVYSKSIFDDLAPAPAQIETQWDLGTLPDLNQVLLKYAFGPDMIRLITAEQHDIQDRSASAMNLAYGCAQMGLTDNEIMAIMLATDDKWGKFKLRNDREKRLAHIITVARNKYPTAGETSDDEVAALILGFKDLLEADIQLEWVAENFITKGGTVVMAGPSGIGKTQFMLQLMIHLALGKTWMDYTITETHKIVFFSLEMSAPEVKFFIANMAKELTDEELNVLNDNLIVVALGESLPLNTPEGQAFAERILDALEPDGVIIDSIGSSIQGNLSSDETVIPVLDWNDRVRKRYNMFTGFIHHMTKMNNQDGPITQDKIYGNQYIVNRASSAFGLLPGKDGNIKVRNFKLRFAAKKEDFLITRSENLTFTKLNSSVDTQIASYVAVDESGKVSDVSPGGIQL